MGGHGGLNILPQKKWNVYNMENRNIVERDKRQERERQQLEQQQEHKEQARERIQQLKKIRRKVSQTPSRSSQSSSPQQQQEKSNINAELKKIQDAKKHINLFEQEEEELIKKQNIQARIELEKEFFKDKPYDLSTKFLGAYDQDKPWYVQQRPDDQQQSYQHSYVKQQIKQFKESKDSYYKILDLSKKYQQNTMVSQIQAKKEEDIQPKEEQSKTQSKEEKNKNKRLQKLAIKLRELLGNDAIDSEEEKKKQKQKQYEREKLRKERLQRERVERSREQKLLALKYEFKES